MQAPTHSNGKLGNDNWGLGPSFVVLHLDKGSPWVYGVLVNNVWSLGTSNSCAVVQQRPDPAVPQLQPAGRRVSHVGPILTVNWKAEGSQHWTVPIGGGVGKIFHFGKLPVNTQVSAYYNVVRPDDTAELADPRAGAVHVPEVVHG